MIQIMRATQTIWFRCGIGLAVALLCSIAFRASQREAFCKSLLLLLANGRHGHFFKQIYQSSSSIQSLSAGLEAVFLSSLLGERFGRAILYLRTAEFAAALAAQLESGGTLLNSLRPAAAASGSLLILMHQPAIEEGIKEGLRVHQALALPAIFPPLFLQMIETAEESGSFPESCRQASSFLQSDANNAIDTAASLLEPLAVLGLGAILGGICLLMMLPLVEVVSHL